MSDELDCGNGGGSDTFFGLRIGSVFIILVTSTAGALFPVLAKQSTWFHVPKNVFEYALVTFAADSALIQSSFAKYFGSGVIVRQTFTR